MIAAAAPSAVPVPRMPASKREANSIVAIVTPDIGLFEDPTTPAIYAATAENKNPNINMIIERSAAI